MDFGGIVVFWGLLLRLQALPPHTCSLLLMVSARPDRARVDITLGGRESTANKDLLLLLCRSPGVVSALIASLDWADLLLRACLFCTRILYFAACVLRPLAKFESHYCRAWYCIHNSQIIHSRAVLLVPKQFYRPSICNMLPLRCIMSSCRLLYCCITADVVACFV